MSKHLVVCDLGSIETRGTYWVAGDPALDRVFGAGLDAYVDFGTHLYGKLYQDLDPKQKNISDDEKEDRKNKRQLAKPAVLGCGYGLGGGDWGFDKNSDEIKTGLWGYSENMGVEIPKEFAHECVQKYRKAYPEVPKMWHKLESAAIQAVQTGRQFEACRMVFGCVKPGKLLYIILPSGRRLHYIRPRVETTERWDGEFSSKLKYESQIGHGFWGHTWTWGGKLMENVVQALSRDAPGQGRRLFHRRALPRRNHLRRGSWLSTKRRTSERMYDRSTELGTGPPVGCGGLGRAPLPQMIELHNNLSPDQKIYVDPKTIIAIEPWNSGAAIITLSTGLHIAVSETVEEVYRKGEQQ